MWKYPDEVIEYARANVKGRRPAELALLLTDEFNMDFTASKVKALMHNHGLTSGLPKVMKGERKKLLSPEEDQFILDNFNGTGHQDMANLLNERFGTCYTREQMKAYYARNRLNSGLTRRFEKGQESWNKGKPKSWVGGEETQFRKGNVPPNRVPIGTERIDSKDGYIYVKIQDNHLNKNWKQKHVLIWEEHNGPVPAGHCILFGNSDKRNFDISNLICVSRKQLARLNQSGLIQNDIELTKTGIVIADIKSKIGEVKKRNKASTRRYISE